MSSSKKGPCQPTTARKKLAVNKEDKEQGRDSPWNNEDEFRLAVKHEDASNWRGRDASGICLCASESVKYMRYVSYLRWHMC